MGAVNALAVEAARELPVRPPSLLAHEVQNRLLETGTGRVLGKLCEATPDKT